MLPQANLTPLAHFASVVTRGGTQHTQTQATETIEHYRNCLSVCLTDILDVSHRAVPFIELGVSETGCFILHLLTA
jgi:hypothetical protein